MQVKNILFKLKLKGNGIVNYDGGEHQPMLEGTHITIDYDRFGKPRNNVSYAKKRFYKDGDSTRFKIVISSDCLKKDMFKEDIPFQSPNIVHNENIMLSYMASPASLLKGYMFLDKKESFKRKGALSLSYAEQTCGATSTIETFSRSGKKDDAAQYEDKHEKTKSDNTFFKKETIGNIEYYAQGQLDLNQLQFVSCDQIFDRYAFNPDKFAQYKAWLKTRVKSFGSELGYFTMNNSIAQIPERGFMLSNEDVVFLVKEMFMRLLKIDIKRNSNFVQTTEVSYKLVYDVLEDRFDNESGWEVLSTKKDVDSIKFNMQEFYTSVDIDSAKDTRDSIEKDEAKRKQTDKDAKAKETERKNEFKKKKAESNSTEKTTTKIKENA